MKSAGPHWVLPLRVAGGLFCAVGVVLLVLSMFKPSINDLWGASFLAEGATMIGVTFLKKFK